MTPPSPKPAAVEVEISPLPWGYFDAHEDIEDQMEIIDAAGEHVMYVDGEAMAAFIVRAANAHGALCEALKDLIASAIPNEIEHPTMWAAWTKAKSALSLATGEAEAKEDAK